MSPCLQEESVTCEKKCKEKWLPEFCDFAFILERLRVQDPLFKPPAEPYHYLHYHLLCSLKGNNNYQMNNISLNYDQIEVSVKMNSLNAIDFYVDFLTKSNI